MLQLNVTKGDEVQFAYQQNGKNITLKTTAKGNFLPPWDRAVRVGLIAKGMGDGVFDGFKLRSRGGE